MTRARNARTLTPAHLKAGILADSKFQFLQALVVDVPDLRHDDEQATPIDDDVPGDLPPAASVHSKLPSRGSARLRSARTRGGGGSRSRPNRRLPLREDEEEVDELDEEEEDADDDDVSSNDNFPAAGAVASADSTLACAPIAQVIDDDYDAV